MFPSHLPLFHLQARLDHRNSLTVFNYRLELLLPEQASKLSTKSARLTLDPLKMTTLYPQVVLLGDSLLEYAVVQQDGFSLQGALQTLLIRRYDVINRGLSGWNSSDVLPFLSEIFPERLPFLPKMDYLVILLGANDAAIPTNTPVQHVPIDVYQENLRSIILHARVRAHSPKILLVTPPPVDEIKLTQLDMAAGQASASRTADITAAYAEKAREVARDTGVILVDLWHAIMKRAIAMTPGDELPAGVLLGSLQSGRQGGLDQLLTDGLHMGSEAYKIFFDELLPHIDGKWGLGDKTDYRLPDWRSFDNA